MFSDFDFLLLNDPDFKEDSVREELIVPLIKNLGYSPSGSSRVIRSKALIHPYVSIGSQPRKISIIPDYVFLADEKPLWILDAKSPTEDILKSSHVEQAYSYAIHPEIRAEMYALCNGREFALYEVRKFDPILYFKLSDIDKVWDKLYRILNSEMQANPELVNYDPDYGLFLKRIGAVDDLKFIAPFFRCNMIMKVEDGRYTTTAKVPGDVDMAITLDFGQTMLDKLLSFQPDELAEATRSALKRQPFYILLDSSVYEFEFGVVAHMIGEVMHNAEESYIPFEVDDIMEYPSFMKEGE